MIKNDACTKVSALIFTRNERKNLSRLLPLIRGFVDEIVIVDGCSTDGTQEIALKNGARVYVTKPIGYCDPCRMFGINKTSYSWIFYLDADEMPSKQLLNDLKKIIQDAEMQGYHAIRFRRINFYVGAVRPLLHLFQPDYQIRLFKKKHIYYKGVVHEQPEVYGKILDLKNHSYYIVHSAYGMYTFKGLRHKLVKYAYLASRMRRDKVKSALLTLMLPISIVCRVCKYLILKKGFLDGFQGIEATLTYTAYLTVIDILKTFRGQRGDRAASVANLKGLTWLCQEVLKEF